MLYGLLVIGCFCGNVLKVHAISKKARLLFSFLVDVLPPLWYNDAGGKKYRLFWQILFFIPCWLVEIEFRLTACGRLSHYLRIGQSHSGYRFSKSCFWNEHVLESLGKDNLVFRGEMQSDKVTATVVLGNSHCISLQI